MRGTDHKVYRSKRHACYIWYKGYRDKLLQGKVDMRGTKCKQYRSTRYIRHEMYMNTEILGVQILLGYDGHRVTAV